MHESDVNLVVRMQMSMIAQEPCRICGNPIGDDPDCVYAGYAAGNISRSGHGYCWDTVGNDRSRWVLPEDAD